MNDVQPGNKRCHSTEQIASIPCQERQWDERRMLEETRGLVLRLHTVNLRGKDRKEHRDYEGHKDTHGQPPELEKESPHSHSLMVQELVVLCGVDIVNSSLDFAIFRMLTKQKQKGEQRNCGDASRRQEIGKC